jgi:hypothetical protein
MSTDPSPGIARNLWILWIVVAFAWAVPLCGGVLWLLTFQPGSSSEAAAMLAQAMTLCVMGMALTSMLNLWLYLWRRRSSQSTRWLAQGFGWSVFLLFLAVAWIALLYLGVTGDHSHNGAFLGWFGYALILVAMLSFNVGLLWQRSNMRRRRRSSRRAEPAAV